MSARPIVDGIEREHAGELTVIRINIQEPAGKALAARFGFEFTPTFLLFDGRGAQILRMVGAIDPSRIRQALAEQQGIR